MNTDLRVWQTIFKLTPPICPVCKVPIRVQSIERVDEEYLLLYGGEIPDRPTLLLLWFGYNIKKEIVIAGSRSDKGVALLEISNYRITGVVNAI